MSKVVLITGASSGFGRLTAEAITKKGHVVYGSMRQIATRNASVVEQMAAFSRENLVDLRALELDVQSQESVDAAVEKVIAEQGRIDVLIHNAGHMVFGPAEAFTPEQYAEIYDVNVLSSQRVNRAVLPFRVHIDPTMDGADVGFAVLDRIRAEMLHRVGLSDLLKPRTQL
jgi:NADP-dependent 3-hydroxy acid dehydrogenase YdfG